MNQIFKGYAHKGIHRAGLVVIASILLTTVSCGDGTTGPTEEDRNRVSEVKEGLTIGFDSGDSADWITGGEDGRISLPDTEGDDTTITWASSSPGVIDSSGKVTRPAEVTTLILTATISKNGATETKKFTLTVHPLGRKAEITELTITSGGADYPVGFANGTTADVIIPSDETIPEEITIKSVTLSDGATGPASGDKAALSSDATSITVTAEDGTTQTVYTVTLYRIIGKIPKSKITDRRWHYVVFNIQSKTGTDLGEYKFGLKSAAEEAPTAAELTDGDGIYRKVTDTAVKNLIAYTLDAGIGGYAAGENVQNHVILHGNGGADVDQYLLSPGTQYNLYAMKVGADRVYKAAAFTTDEYDASSSPFVPGSFNDDEVLKGAWVYDPKDAIFISPSIFGTDKPGDFENFYLDVDVTEMIAISLTQIGDFQITPGWSILLPSQTTDGSVHYNNAVGGKTVFGMYVCLPQAELKDLRLGHTITYSITTALPIASYVLTLSRQ